MKNKLNIIFMGTPDFAVPPLKALHESEHEISLVVTQPDRKKGRGKKVIFSPVKQFANEYNYDVYQPSKINSEESFNVLSALKPDILVVVAYGQILSEKVLDIPAIAPINIHGSILPEYRGSAPIQWSIINGEEKTGVTTMIMDKGMDTGDMLLSKETEIKPEDTAQDIHDRLSEIGAELIIDTLDCIRDENKRCIKQDNSKASYAPMLSKTDGRIIWDKKSSEINNLVRGVTPWPGAFTFAHEKRYKIFKVKPVLSETGEKPGTILSSKDELIISTGDGAVSILEIQGSSGKRLKIEEFLRGFSFPPDTFFE